MAGAITERSFVNASKSLIIQDHKEKPLIFLKIKMSENNYINANVYKDDTSSSVADRVWRQANIKNMPNEKEKKKMLANYIE